MVAPPVETPEMTNAKLKRLNVVAAEAAEAGFLGEFVPPRVEGVRGFSEKAEATFAAPKVNSGAPTAAAVSATAATTGLESRPSCESLASTRVSDSSSCSKRTKEKREKNFFDVLATKEFRILSRRSKYGLTAQGPEGRLAFVKQGEGKILFSLLYISLRIYSCIISINNKNLKKNNFNYHHFDTSNTPLIGSNWLKQCRLSPSHKGRAVLGTVTASTTRLTQVPLQTKFFQLSSSANLPVNWNRF